MNSYRGFIVELKGISLFRNQKNFTKIFFSSLFILVAVQNHSPSSQGGVLFFFLKKSIVFDFARAINRKGEFQAALLNFLCI